MWALLLSSAIGLIPDDPLTTPGAAAPAPQVTLKLETVNGQVVKLSISHVVWPDSQVERAETSPFVDAMRRRFANRKAGAP